MRLLWNALIDDSIILQNCGLIDDVSSIAAD